MTQGLALALALLLAATQVSAQTVVEGASLRIVNAAGELIFDDAGLRVTTTAVVKIVNPEGGVELDGNELSVFSLTPDPPKLRLAGPGIGIGAVTFNVLTNPLGGGQNDQHELVHIRARRSSDEPSGIGGQLEFWSNTKWTDTMHLSGVISPAYTSDGRPVIHFQPATVTGDLSQFTDSPVIFPPIALTAQVNLTGALADLALPDGHWMTAINPNGDVDLSMVVSVPGDVTHMFIEVCRTRSGGNAPYIYISVDGSSVISGYQPSSAETIQFPIAPGMRHVYMHVAGQEGSLDIGSVRVR